MFLSAPPNLTSGRGPGTEAPRGVVECGSQGPWLLASGAEARQAAAAGPAVWSQWHQSESGVGVGSVMIFASHTCRCRCRAQLSTPYSFAFLSLRYRIPMLQGSKLRLSLLLSAPRLCGVSACCIQSLL